MALEINKPAWTKHWLVTNGTLVHIGRTEIGQVTTTGMPTLESSDSEMGLVDKLQKHSAKIEVLPARGIKARKAYVYNGEVFITKDEVESISKGGVCNPTDNPECFTKKTVK